MIEGDPEAQLALRFSLFQLLIAAPRFTEHASIGAKTLSGFGYRHHVFWDTETFMVPPFSYSQPEIARNMLMYRWHGLPGARDKARANGHRGAQFPWESAGTGEEVTPTWVPDPDDRTKLIRIWTGDIEIHITADIALAVMQYWQVTGDDTFICEHGAELILDGAVFWASAAALEDDGQLPLPQRRRPRRVPRPRRRQRLHQPAGRLAPAHRRHDGRLARRAPPGALDGAVGSARPSTPRSWTAGSRWRRRCTCRWVPTGCSSSSPATSPSPTSTSPSCATRPARSRCSSATASTASRETQVLKQPDVLMLAYLLPELFAGDALARNYAYYDPRTDHEHGSSLGPAISAVMACRAGEPEVGYQHFLRAARADLLDVRHNAGDGIHGASAGGLWQAVVFGFAGLEVTADGWHTTPMLPTHWTRVEFSFDHHGVRQHVVVEA